MIYLYIILWLSYLACIFVRYNIGPIYTQNKCKFVNYSIGDILLSVLFFPIEFCVIFVSSEWLRKRPFRRQILKVGDKLNVDGQVREVLDVAMNKDFEEVVKLSGYTMYQLGEWRLSKDIKDNKISPLQELL